MSQKTVLEGLVLPRRPFWKVSFSLAGVFTLYASAGQRWPVIGVGASGQGCNSIGKVYFDRPLRSSISSCCVSLWFAFAERQPFGNDHLALVFLSPVG